MSTAQTFQVGSTGRDQLFLTLKTQEGKIIESKLTGVGCPELLKLLGEWRPKLQGDLQALSVPTGVGHAQMLFRELILRAKGEWLFPYKEDELCHCRAVPTQKVDEAVICGAHTVLSVSQRTSAGTSCGTCKPDIEQVLKYRLAK